MRTNTEDIVTIEKELLEGLHFPAQQVLSDNQQILERKNKARNAMFLGNSSKIRVKIVFEDNEGKKMVVTTVWGVTERYLLLKGGMSLPLHRVYDIIM